MSTIQDGTRSDEARARVEDRNNLDAINKIYVGTGESITVNGHTVWQTEGKNIIKAINDAGTVAKAENANSATNAGYATSAGNATTADLATSLTSTGTIGNYRTNEIINFENGFVRNANYATNAGNATTADNAGKTDLTNEKFKGNLLNKDIYIDFDEGKDNYYYFFMWVPYGGFRHVVDLGVVYFNGGTYDSWSAIATCYGGNTASNLTLDEYVIRIVTSGIVSVWKKDNTTGKWVQQKTDEIQLFYKKIR